MRLSKALWFVVPVTALAAYVFAQSDQPKESMLKAALGEEQYMQSGLNKLTIDEQENLVGLLGSGIMVSYAERAAERYMEKEGWRRVRLLGAVRTGHFSDDYLLLVWDHYQLYSLDPSIVPYMPDPGIYWAKNTGSFWKLMYPDASTGSFQAESLD